MTETGQGRFSRCYRVTRSSDYRRIYKKGRRGRSAYYTVFFEINHLPYSRFGLTVSKKLGSAVRRNRVKRVFREALRVTRKDVMAGYDFVFNPHQSALSLKTPVLTDDLARLFRDLKDKYGSSINTQRD